MISKIKRNKGTPAKATQATEEGRQDANQKQQKLEEDLTKNHPKT